MSKHTPGPWVVVGRLTKYVEARLVGRLIQEVAACGPTMADEGYGQQQEANARLIAAAPDLLEALQWYEAKAVQMGRAAIHQDSKLMLELMKEIAVEYGAQARAAIAKATGENT